MSPLHSRTLILLRRSAGIALLALGYLALPTLIILALRFSFSANSTTRWVVVVASVLFIAIYSPWQTRAIRWGRRLLSVSAKEIIEDSESALVLYLRPFQHDNDYFGAPPPRGRLRLLSLPDERIGVRPEERLVIVAYGAGPMIALARPGERLPQIGAARIYIEHTESDEDWKAVVADLCHRAELVILQLGTAGPGLLWEIQNVPKLVKPERLVIYLPASNVHEEEIRQLQFGEFLQLYGQYFPKSLPYNLGDARCIVFDPDWTPTVVGPWSLPVRSNLAILNEHHGLVLTPALLGLNDDAISLVSAIERNHEDYTLPRESELPLDLRVQRIFDIMFGPICKVAVFLALLLIVWPDLLGKVQDWLSRWL
jgi:hypothetical protein